MNKHQVEINKFSKMLRTTVFKLDKKAGVVLLDIENHYSDTKVGSYDYDRTTVRITVFHGNSVAFAVTMSINLTMKQMKKKITEKYKEYVIETKELTGS